MSTTARNVKLSIAYLFHGEIRPNLNLSNISDSVALSGNVSAGFLFNRSSSKVVYHQPINFLVDQWHLRFCPSAENISFAAKSHWLLDL